MNKNRLIELLNAAADDDICADERRELDAFLQADSEAQNIAARFDELHDYLGRVEKIAPPLDLRDRIMQQLPMRPRTAPAKQEGPKKISLISGALWHAASAAFGALLAITFYESQSPMTSPMDITDLVGTIAPGSTNEERVVLDRLSVAGQGVSSRAVLARRHGLLVLDVSIDAGRQISITVNLADAGLQFGALVQDPGSLESIRFESNLLTVAGTGQRRFSILLHEDSGSPPADNAGLKLDFSSEGKLLGQGSLGLNR